MRAKFGRGPTVSKKATHIPQTNKQTSYKHHPPGVGWVNLFYFLKVRVSIRQICYPHMRAKFGRGPTVVSKKVSFKFMSRYLKQAPLTRIVTPEIWCYTYK